MRPLTTPKPIYRTSRHCSIPVNSDGSASSVTFDPHSCTFFCRFLTLIIFIPLNYCLRESISSVGAGVFSGIHITGQTRNPGNGEFVSCEGARADVISIIAEQFVRLLPALASEGGQAVVVSRQEITRWSNNRLEQPVRRAGLDRLKARRSGLRQPDRPFPFRQSKARTDIGGHGRRQQTVEAVVG